MATNIQDACINFAHVLRDNPNESDDATCSAVALSSAIESNIQSAGVSGEYQIQTLKDNMDALRFELLDTLQLMFHDLIDTVVEGNDASKLFYLKSKLETVLNYNEHSVLSQAGINYTQLLNTELNKLNQ